MLICEPEPDAVGKCSCHQPRNKQIEILRGMYRLVTNRSFAERFLLSKHHPEQGYRLESREKGEELGYFRVIENFHCHKLFSKIIISVLPDLEKRK